MKTDPDFLTATYQAYCGISDDVVLPQSAQSALESDLLEELALVRQERDAARRALAKASEERARLIANMSHEMRTPLNAILGYADLILLKRHEAETVSADVRHVETIREAGSHLLSVVESVLNLSRLRAGGLLLAEADIAPQDIIASVIRVLAPIAARAQVTLVSKCRSDVPRVHADPQVLRQILINLVSNAIKAAPAHTQVTIIAILKSNGSLQFQVRDCGKGMDPATIEKVMQPFVQQEKAQGFASAGAGLGLPLVRSLAELHDGRFQLVSHVGKGTRALVTLPSARVCRPLKPGQQAEFSFTRAPSPLDPFLIRETRPARISVSDKKGSNL
jgi:two-component system, cell cycle sensor histidine kinase PleC